VDEEDDTTQSNGADRQAARQPSLLLPIDGTRARGAQSGASAFDDWQPDDEIDDAWAAANVPELSNPRDPKIVARFKDHWRGVKGRIPPNFAAAYRKWLLDEPHFAKVRGGYAKLNGQEDYADKSTTVPSSRAPSRPLTDSDRNRIFGIA
jgi:hypothetical protein